MTSKYKIMYMVCTTMGILAAGSAQAVQNSNTHMKVTGLTSQPIGHYEYCKAYPTDCRKAGSTKAVTLSRGRWAELDSINGDTNRRVRPVTDMEYYKVEEYWTYPERYGDCEDYVLLKRYRLIQQGWPASALLITVVRQANGEGHAVLTVRTDIADFVLDNLTDKILPWNETGYRFLKRQASADAGAWEGINDARQKAVGSVSK